MSHISRVGSLEINQDLAFQRRAWRVQRVGWAVMTLVILAALLGAFGRGPLASATAGDDAARLRLSYDRIARHGAPGSLEVHLAPGADDTVRLWLDREYVQGLRVESIDPEPQRTELGEDRLTYVFPVADPGRPTTVRFEVRPDKYWQRDGRAGVASGTPVRFTQFVLP